MKKFEIPYYKGTIEFEVDPKRVNGVLFSRAEAYKPGLSEEELVGKALAEPVESPKLSDLAVGKKRILIISSDHTRPVPSAVTMPIILDEIRKKNPDCEITILVATGMHRPPTAEEIKAKYGEKIAMEERIVIHNAYNDDEMIFLGILPSGGELWLNKLIGETDLLIAEGFIEPHFFAGFSGGRKSILPGIASKKTVLWNHNARFIASPYAGAGSLDHNPIHKDMLCAAKKAGLAFILNVVINGKKQIVAAFAGNPEAAHRKGCDFVGSLARVKPVISDIVITGNGGYPLDQNLYQTVKGMTAGEACVKEGGVIIIASSCVNGSGGESFRRTMSEAKSAEEVWKKIISVAPADTEFDQWEAEILARVMMKAHVIVVSRHQDPKLFTDMHLDHAFTIEEALRKADKILGPDKGITIVPDGISIIPLLS